MFFYVGLLSWSAGSASWGLYDWGGYGSWGIMGFYFALVGILSVSACLAALRGVLGSWLSFCDLSLFSVLELDMFVPSFCEFYQILLNCGDWHFGLWGREWAVSWVGWAWFFSSCNSPSAPVFLAALSDWVAVFVIFCLMFFSFGIPPHAGLGDRDAGPAFSREHGHLGTMGEQCSALNGLPMFVNKNE